MISIASLAIFTTISMQNSKPITVHAQPQMKKTTIDGVVATIKATEKAWNEHDIDAYADCLTEDCQWVNVVGMFWDGKASTKKAHVAFHKTMFKDVDIYYDEISMRQLAPNVVVAVVSGGVGAYTTPNGHKNPPGKSRMLCVLVEKDNQFLISAAEVVNVDQIAAQFDPGK